MCKPASFVLTRDNVYWSMKSDSHEDIIREYGLRADGAGNRPNVLRVEITPPDRNFGAPAEQWTYKIDQDELPVWHDPEADEKRARDALPKWIAAHVWLPGWNEAMKFVESLPGLPWLKPDGRPDPSWKLFTASSWDAAGNAARAAAWDAAWDAARDAAWDAAWAAAPAAAWDAARAAAWDAARDAAGDAARDAAGDAAPAAAGNAARAAARDAAWDAARDAAGDAAPAAAGNAARAAAWDAALLARCLIVSDKIDPAHLAHAQARMDVWRRGYALLCDVNGVLYVYTKQ